MKREVGLATVLSVSLGFGAGARAETPATPKRQKGATMAGRAGGTFDVKVKPLPNDEKVEGLAVGRMSLDKQFEGDLEGTSKGEMMTVDTTVQGSAGYVAIERVTATLRGRSGTFTLLHRATMRRGGEFDMSIVVVPDSGTGQLAGLTGTMTIIIADGKHSYELDYTLPEAPSGESLSR